MSPFPTSYRASLDLADLDGDVEIATASFRVDRQPAAAWVDVRENLTRKK